MVIWVAMYITAPKVIEPMRTLAKKSQSCSIALGLDVSVKIRSVNVTPYLKLDFRRGGRIVSTLTDSSANGPRIGSHLAADPGRRKPGDRRTPRAYGGATAAIR